MKKYCIKLKTITPVIISNRINDALYKGVDFDKEKSEKNFIVLGNSKIIYQFPCYEDRSLRTEKVFSYADKYYIPASSIKGALKLSDEYRSLKFKDIELKENFIHLLKLYKFQYLYQDLRNNRDKNKDIIEKPKDIKYTEYYPNIVIEMLMNPKEKWVEGEILSKEEIDHKRIVNQIDRLTRQKLANVVKKIDGICAMKTLDDKCEELKDVKKNINRLLNDTNKKIMFMGGFKGLINSLSEYTFNENEEIKSGFYIHKKDGKPDLPYGLVEIDIYEKSK